MLRRISKIAGQFSFTNDSRPFIISLFLILFLSHSVWSGPIKLVAFRGQVSLSRWVGDKLCDSKEEETSWSPFRRVCRGDNDQVKTLVKPSFVLIFVWGGARDPRTVGKRGNSIEFDLDRPPSVPLIYYPDPIDKINHNCGWHKECRGLCNPFPKNRVSPP